MKTKLKLSKIGLTFDERERAIRGDCYKHTLWAVCALLYLCFILRSGGFTVKPYHSFELIVVFAYAFCKVEMLLRGVAFDRHGAIVVMLTPLYGLCTLALLIVAGVRRILGRPFIENVLLTGEGTLLVAGLMLLAVTVLSYVKIRRFRKDWEYALHNGDKETEDEVQ
ncbi:MAG: hypothetical protein LBN97_06605 [Oscillospiraceae bacterium]|jgi:hypothetical protein|nr:hypothetical protein [Oscillospiraceae bacterium]